MKRLIILIVIVPPIPVQKKLVNAKLVHTHTFNLADLPTALKYARERIDDAIKIVIKPWSL